MGAFRVVVFVVLVVSGWASATLTLRPCSTKRLGWLRASSTAEPKIVEAQFRPTITSEFASW